MKSRLHYIGAIALAIGSAAFVAGCGGGGSGSSTAGGGGARARTTIMLANTQTTARSAQLASAAVRAAGGNGGGPVGISDILSLTVTVSAIYFEYCDSDDTDDVNVPAVVLVKDGEFDPASITVKQGQKVRWEWTTDTEHSITSGAAGDADAGSLFDQTSSGTGSAVELTFADLGDFPYFSNFDDDVSAGMAGVVHVVADDGEDGGGGHGHGNGNGHGNGHQDRVARGEDGGDGKDNGGLGVFLGSFDVDLMDLTALSQVLTTTDIPANDYCGIRLSISNPRLVLASDPNTVITNVHLTANGRLFVKTHFTITGQDDVLIILDFGGIHLVKAGNSGKYVLTPQLKADVSIVDANTELSGDIVSIDPVNRVIQVQTADGIIDVAVSDSTTIASDDDADDSADTGALVTLAFEDLAVGQSVDVTGLLQVVGPVNATAITIADDSIVTNETSLTGTITTIDTGTNVIQVDTGGGTLFDVSVASATITTDDDADDASDTGATVTLAIANLAIGQTVSVQGLIQTGQPIAAAAVQVDDASIDTTTI